MRTVILCSLLAILAFSIQLLFCVKANKKVVKCIPTYIIIAIYVAALIMGQADVLDGSGGVAVWSKSAFLISMANTVALAADIIAWVVYKKKQQKKISPLF